MSLKETVAQMRELLVSMGRDLEKAVKGNKTATQRVRAHSVLFAKVAKVFRQESLAMEKAARKPLKPAARARKKRA